MMKWLIVAVVGLALAAPVFAQADADKTTRVRGVAKEIKADEGKTDSGSLVVAVAKKPQGEDLVTFVVNSDAAIKSGKNDLKLTELKVGDKLRVDYKEADGKKVVVKIRVENDEK